MAFRKRYGSVLRALQGGAQRKPKPLLDERSERNAATSRFLAGTLHEGLI
ncbi:MAG: hypothetical protein ACYCUE_12935 [Steroidobacteraceae bacterium]